MGSGRQSIGNGRQVIMLLLAQRGPGIIHVYIPGAKGRISSYPGIIY